MNLSVDEILELMDETLDKSMQVPFSNKRSLVDVDKMRELVDQIRLNMPGEIKQARKVVQDRKQIVEEAKSEADLIVKKAEDKAKQLTAQQEITRLAQQRANEIMTAAQQKSKDLRRNTNDYIDNSLLKIEEHLTQDLLDVKKARNALKASKL